MKNSFSVAVVMIWAFTLLSSCRKNENNTIQDTVNDYLPLKVGAKYNYSYREDYSYHDEVKKKAGECTWDFISASTDTPVVYQVRQSFNGLSIHRWGFMGFDPSQTDTFHIVNEITTLSFKVLKDRKVTFSYFLSFRGAASSTFERYIQSEKVDTCLFVDYVYPCLKKDVGITNFTHYSCGNHCSILEYSLIKGPFDFR